MSTNIRIQRVCQYCGTTFTAKTTTTAYCSHKCNSRAYKEKVKEKKIEKSNKETLEVKVKPIEVLKAKEFLTVKEVASLLNCSVRSAYYYIETGKIKAVNLGQRVTRVRRLDIDKLFESTEAQPEEKKEQHFELSECYTISETLEKFNISEKALYEVIKRNNIPKIKQGKFSYIPKSIIELVLS